MSTTSFIGLKYKNNVIKGIYCHWDGDINGNGLILNRYYDSVKKIEKLLELGALSWLGPDIGNKVDFNDPNLGSDASYQCLAYHRDRGDTLDITELKDGKIPKDWCYEYIYIFDEDFNTWYVYENGNYTKLSYIIAEHCKTNKNNINAWIKKYDEYDAAKAAGTYPDNN